MRNSAVCGATNALGNHNFAAKSKMSTPVKTAIDGASPGIIIANSSDMDPNMNPTVAYDAPRPKLYRTVWLYLTRRFLVSNAITNGPHMAAQCKDVKKLTPMLLAMPATVNGSRIFVSAVRGVV